ncbi:MAG: helix-turn-helix domain-containing protein [Oscillospiraceae bacterium]|nr:helix-turn-helix domain-containing protein [Oscillospiraceae bacterium]
MDKKTYTREGYLHENYRYFHLRDTAGQERDFHFHDFDKIVLLLSGRVNYLVEDQSYLLRPWDLLLVKHHAIHKALIDRSEPYERIIVYLDRQYFDRALPQARLMDCFESADRSRRYLLVPDGEQRAELGETLRAFERAREDSRFGAEAMRDTLMMQILIQIGRMAPAAPELREQSDPKIRQVLSFINEHLTEELTVEQLSERVYLSRYHFMRLFKAQTGSTVHAYVRQKRLLSAARLIREGVPAAKAAADSGFGDYSAFHRAFKECFGIAPGELKK